MSGITLRIGADCTIGNRDAASGRANALIRAFAERHVPLTPRLAQDMARFEGAGVPVEDPGWGRGFTRAGEAIGMPRVIGATPFWAGAVAVFRLSVAEPVLRRAAAECGAVTLCGAAGLAADGSMRGPHDWARTFEAHVDRLLGDADAMGRGFWIETAVCLHGAAMRSAERRAGLVGSHFGRRPLPPEPDPLLCRLMFEAEPAFPGDFRLRHRKQRSHAVSVRKRSGHRPKEGGVSGIRASTQLEDLPDAMLSELMLPPELMINKLLHEGILVRHRPPFRQPKRDLLSLCLCDRRALGQGACLVKAAWADAALRLQMILAQMGLQRSDLIWSERTVLGVAADVLRVEAVELVRGLDPMLLQGEPRTDRLARSGLLPGFLDTLAAIEPPDDPGTPEENEAFSALVRGGLDRLHTRFRVGTGHLGKAKDVRHRPGDYFRRVVFVVLPDSHPDAGRIGTDWPSVRTGLRADLRKTIEEDVVIAVLVVPSKVVAGARFVAAGDTVPVESEVILVPDDLPEDEALNAVLGGLSALFIQTTMEAVDAR